VAIVVLDASVLIGHLDSRDRHHDACVQALRTYASHELRAPASAYAETLVRPAAVGKLAEARAALEKLAVSVGSVDAACAERAAELRASRRPLRLPDALVLAYAEIAGAEVVLTTDRSWRRASTRVRVIA
jgi:predicted nucleic acid-binding protein